MNSCKWGTVAMLMPFAITLYSCKSDAIAERREAQITQIESFLRSRSLPYIQRDGVYIATRTPGFGYSVVTGDSLSFYYIGYTLDGRVFDTNLQQVALEQNLNPEFRRFEPLQTVAGSNALIEGLSRGLPYSKGGDVTTLVFPSDYGFGSEHKAQIPPWSPIAYDVLITSVYNPSIRNEIQTIEELVERYQQPFSIDILSGFLHSRVNSQGVKPTLNDTIWGWYRGFTPLGELVHEAQTPNQLIALGSNSLPVGLLRSFTILSRNDTATVILPSYLAFGVEGGGIVEPYMPLVYSIRLDSIK